MTRYTEFDFFEVNWGILKTIAPGRIWSDSVEGIYLSDLAIQLKAQDSSLNRSRLIDESKKIFKLFPIQSCLETKEELPFRS